MQVFLILISCIASYLIGSLNFAIIICKLTHKEDIRSLGSKNAGMTNMLRVYGKGPAIFTALGDLLKGILAILLCKLIFFLAGIAAPVWVSYLVGIMAILGHSFPIFYGFRGGKGVLIAIGMVLLLTPLPALAILGVFLIVLAFSCTVSLSSMIAAVTAPLWVWLFGWLTSDEDMLAKIIGTAVMALFIIGMHWSNIVRLAHGEENTFRKKKGTSVDADDKQL